MSKKVTILMGAGAAIPWGGPTSHEITKAICDDDYYHAMDGTPIAEYIFKQFENQFHNTQSLNFETMLTILEAVYDYYDTITIKGTNPLFNSVWPYWFRAKELIDNIMDFEVKEFNENHPDDGEFVLYRAPKSSANSFNQWPKGRTTVKYFSELIGRFNGLITNFITGYDSECISDKNNPLNTGFSALVNDYLTKGYKVRIYTTNYDRLVPLILKNLDVFDGFLTTNYDKDKPIYPMNLSKIINDRSCLTYYNLHGSIYWYHEMNTQSIRTEFQCNPLLPNSYDPIPRSEFVDPGTRIILSNIVTGYNKTRRVSIPPLNYFEHSFIMDLIESDELITVGTGFTDPNINKNLALAFQHNNNLKFTHVTFANKDFLSGFTGNQIKEIIGYGNDEFILNKVVDDWLHSNNRQYAIYLGGFEKYLMEQLWRE